MKMLTIEFLFERDAWALTVNHATTYETTFT